MNLYLISQNVNNGYDTFNSAVVAAETKEEAINIHPGGGLYEINVDNHVWATTDKVSAEIIGVAKDRTKSGIICASFNAG